MRKLVLLEKRVRVLEAEVIALQSNLSTLSTQLVVGTAAPVANPTTKNSIVFDALLGKLFVAKPDLTGWITIIG